MENMLSMEPMLDIFIYESFQNLEQLEKLILESERRGVFHDEAVNEIFRIMHTIKGSSSMMLYTNIASLSHALEDVFQFIRENDHITVDNSKLSDLVLESADFIRTELEKIQTTKQSDAPADELVARAQDFLQELRGESPEKPAKEFVGTESVAVPVEEVPQSASSGQTGVEEQQEITELDEPESSDAQFSLYEGHLFFEENCEMENIRAFYVVNNFTKIGEVVSYYPPDITENSQTADIVRKSGFTLTMKTARSYDLLLEFLQNSPYVERVELTEILPEAAELSAEEPEKPEAIAQSGVAPAEQAAPSANEPTEMRIVHQSMISVDVKKLDMLMDMVGELVIAEAMVTQNPELATLKLNNFYKASRQLRKITGEIQDMVMTIRMVPLAPTFRKMNRVVRDMSHKLNKEVDLILIGENTEVDKNIIEHISDPLMHIVRNSVDHGIEMPDEREAMGKPRKGTVVLEAKNAGGDVIVTIRDDGRGLDKERILDKAASRGLLTKSPEDMTDKEIFNLIFLPGFSTNETITEYSGRGVGMDVAIRNLEEVGGSVTVDSTEGRGMVTTLKIPLTLAIIDGMNIRVGEARYTLPTTSIKETFRAKKQDLIRDPEGMEMIMLRGQCYPIVRLHQIFNVKTDITDFTQGIMLVIEYEGKTWCLFADELIGQYQVVVKALPDYMKNIRRVEGLAGCTLLGDGSISLILNISGLLNL